MITAAANNPGWLYSKPFDTFFIFGNVAIAVFFGIVALEFPKLFPAILAVNLWILGYHHVIATFTRLCFDKESHRRSILLIYALFPAMFALVLYLAHTAGIWVIATVYLYGQWFHYSRQSWGISRAYERNAPKGYTADRSWQTQAAFYSFPLWGILYRSYQHPDFFLSLPFKALPVSLEVVQMVGIISMSFFVMWLWRVYKDWKQGVLPVAYVCFMLSHFGIFSLAYLIMPTLDSGWLVANIWHNLQYLSFVWLFNHRTYRAGIDPQAKFLSLMSQRKNVWFYFLVTLTISTALYAGINFSVTSLGMTALLIVYMSINFHHYIVDAIIWRVSWIRRAKPVPPAPAAS